MSRSVQAPQQVRKAPAKADDQRLARQPQRGARQPAWLQAKLAVSRPGDSAEREADQVAQQVARTPRDTIQRASLEPAITPEKKEESLAPKRDDAPPANVSQLARATLPRAPATATQIRRSASDDEPVPTQAVADSGDEVESDAALAAESLADPTGQPLAAATEARIAALRGQGSALPEDVRQDMENQFGRDLSNVRIHDDATAAGLCAEVKARAFTVGNDIFFAPGEHAPDTDAGRELLAHEITHVVQQGGSASSKVMRKRKTKDSAGAGGTPLTNRYRDDAMGEINTGEAKLIKIKQLRVPSFKTKYFRDYRSAGKPLFWRTNAEHGGEERDTDQRGAWNEAVESSSDEKTSSLLRRAHRTDADGKYIYYFSYNSSYSYLFGSEDDIKTRTQRPTWRGSGQPASFHVDHQVEYQLGGDDVIDNMWLLDGSINSSSGTRIDTELENTVSAFVADVQDKVLNPPADLAAARSGYRIEIEDVTGGLGSYDVNHLEQYYNANDIKQGRQLKALNPMSQREIDESGLLTGNPDNIDLFPSTTGGYRYRLVRSPGSNIFRHGEGPNSGIGTNSGKNAVAAQNFEISQVQYDAATHSGSINIKVPSREVAAKLPRNPPQVDVDPIPILPMTGIEWGGRFDKEALKRSVKEKIKDFPGFSPLNLDDVDLNPGGITMLGSITPTLPLLKNASISYRFDGDTFTIWKTFNGDEISLPGPFQINTSSLTLFGSNAGIGVEGRVDFGIEGLGEGFLAGVASATFKDGAGFAIEGGFNFDTSIFDPAEIRIRYAESQFSGSGQLGIPEGKIPGVRSASIDANFTADQFSADGTAELDVPGVEQGTLNLSYSEADGFAVGGKFTLSPDTPGIKGGSISANLKQRANGGGYSVSAQGEAQPDIPGIDSKLIVKYDDGAFSADFSGAFQRGMLAGQVSVGVTNRTVGADGLPTGDPAPGAPLVVYGSGSATVKLAPWLQGTAGVRFAPDGEVTVQGEIGLPNQVEIFPRKEIDKRIFGINLPIPIVPGIFAEVGGGLSAHAGIGPGLIDQLTLGVEYNPAHEENTRVTGDGHVMVPADAGLRLAVHGGIGLGIPAASVSGGLEVGGELGIAGAAEAGVHIDWTPVQGLQVDAYGRLSAQPKFLFDVAGYVDVEALMFTIYEKRWQLAKFEYGSDMTFGVNFPIRYREGEAFALSLDDVRFEVPPVSATEVLGGLVKRLV